MKPTRTWIVITDGTRSRILLNTGPGKGVEEVSGADMRSPLPKNRDRMADRPGRTHESADSARHAYDARTDQKRQSKVNFTKELAEFLDRALMDEKFDRVILAADPKSLGSIRGFLNNDVKDRMIGELAKDLTKIPDCDIASHFDSLINL